MREFKFLSIILIVFLLITIVFSYSPLLFNNYKAILSIDNNNVLTVNKTYSLQNIYVVAIVPGELDLKIGNTGNYESKIEDVKIVDNFNNKIKYDFFNTKSLYLLRVFLFSPIPPGYKYQVRISYKIKLKNHGLFFKTFETPLDSSNVPIQDGKLTLKIPKNKYINTIELPNNISYTKTDNIINIKFHNQNLKNKIIAVEYSSLPIYTKKIRLSLIILITLNILLIILLLILLKKKFSTLE